jgi:hypothetical protein
MSMSNGHGGARRGAGRPPKSPELHELEGTWNVTRHGPRPVDRGRYDELDGLTDAALSVAAEVQADEPVEAPNHLVGLAAGFWCYLQPWVVAEHGRDAAGPALILLTRICELMMTADTARETLATAGQTFVTNSGMIRARPEIAIQRDAIAEIRNSLSALNIL